MNLEHAVASCEIDAETYTSDEDPAGSADRSAKDGHLAFICRDVS